MQFSFEELINSKKGQFYLVSGRERDIDNIKRKNYDNTDSFVRIIRGQRCSSKESLFQEFAAALEFPYYFGNNWDAFDECIVDLSWLPSNRYLFFITNFDKLLVNNPEDLHIFLDVILKNAVLQSEHYDQFQKAMPFNIVFHCEPENEEKCRKILEKENLSVHARALKQLDDIV